MKNLGSILRQGEINRKSLFNNLNSPFRESSSKSVKKHHLKKS